MELKLNLTEGNSKYKLHMNYPASWWNNMWREAIPAGNGKIGALVYGGVGEETILLNHNQLWHSGRKHELPDVSHTLAETRSLMREGKYSEADWHMTNTVLESGYESRLGSILPLGDICLTMACSQVFRNYSRSLNMETGEITVQWEDAGNAFERKLFVSRTDDAVIYEIKGPTGLVSGEFSLRLHPSEESESNHQAFEPSCEVVAREEFLYYAATNDDGKDFGIVLRLIIDEGRINARNGSLRFDGAGKVLVVAKAFAGSDRKVEWVRLHEELKGMNPQYERLLTGHAIEHNRLFNSVSLNLFGDQDHLSNEELLLQAYKGEAPISLVEKMWASGRYLFLSGTAKDGMPFSLYGLWGGDYRLTWPHHMANENVQMIYWHTMAGGLDELIPPLISYYNSMMEDFRTNAKKLFGFRGIYIPAGTTPGIGVPNQIVPVIMNWTSAAGWLSRHYYEYYQYTGDRELLTEKVLPFMREVALFYEDFLEFDEDGHVRYYPSVSPENSPLNFMPHHDEPMSHPMPTTINATMDLAIMKELLTHLIQASKEVGMYTEELNKWTDLLVRIPPYQFNKDGAIREWMHPDFDDNDCHRHLSHIYPIFPGQEFTREFEPELFNAFETTVNNRMLGAQSGWSLAHMSAIYARLGDGNRAAECLDILARSCLLNNFLTLHNDWRKMGVCLEFAEAPIQLDAVMGWVHAVQEMLLYVSPSFVKLLPAIPDKWKKGEFSGLRYTTGVVSLSWDRQIGHFDATLQAVRDTDMTLKLPEWLEDCSFTGEGVVVAPSDAGQSCYMLKMRAGQALRIESKMSC